jgi:hypothetical protein
MTKVVVGIIAIVVLMIMFPLVMSATHDIQTDEQTDSELTLTGTPPAGVVTLTKALFSGDTDHVVSLIGNGTEDPGDITAVSYVTATKVLNVTGVDDSTKLTVTYDIDALTEYTGMGAMVGLTPLLIWIAILGSVIGGLFFALKGRFAG